MRPWLPLPLALLLGCSPTVTNPGPSDATALDVAASDAGIDAPATLDVRLTTDLGTPDRGAPIDRGSGPLPEYASCVVDGVVQACATGLNCVYDANPPTVGMCRRICSTSAQCTGDAQCVPNLLDDGHGLCGTARAVGESCETGIEGPDNCAAPTGGRAACVGGTCVQACRVGTTSYPCPTGSTCSTDTVTSNDITGAFRVCRASGSDGGVATVPDSAVSTNPAYPMGCLGTAMSTGSGAGVTLNAHFIESYHTPSPSGITLLLTGSSPDSLGAYDTGLLVEFTPVDGQLSYRTTTGTLRCGLIRYDGTAWQPVSEPSGGCGLELSTMRLASPSGTCNGALVGVVAAVWGLGGTGIRGTFSVSTAVAQGDVGPPPCRPRDSRCTSASQCCSGSCPPVFGTCQ